MMTDPHTSAWMAQRLLIGLSDDPVSVPPMATMRAAFQAQADALSGRPPVDFMTCPF
jgi:hypothetical protein